MAVPRVSMKTNMAKIQAYKLCQPNSDLAPRIPRALGLNSSLAPRLPIKPVPITNAKRLRELAREGRINPAIAIEPYMVTHVFLQVSLGLTISPRVHWGGGGSWKSCFLRYSAAFRERVVSCRASDETDISPPIRCSNRSCMILSFQTSILICFFKSSLYSLFRLSVASLISSNVASSGIPNSRYRAAVSRRSCRARRSCSRCTFQGSFL